MGQYYSVYAKKHDGIAEVYDITRMDKEFVGLKLMEHSWLPNTCVNTIMKRLFEDGPYTIIWMGDYARNCSRLKEVQQEGEDLYAFVWGEDSKCNEVSLKKDPLDLWAARYYLVNHTTKEYVDLTEYSENNTNEDGWCVHPLPLLTAIGNGEGGGDYHGTDMDLVGYWAGGEIQVTDKVPDGYTALDVHFAEEY